MRDFSSMRDLLPAFLAKLANESGSASGLLPFWAEVVGESIAKHSKPIRLENGTLTIATTNAEWKRELGLRETALVSRLSSRLGAGKIRRLEFVAGK